MNKMEKELAEEATKLCNAIDQLYETIQFQRESVMVFENGTNKPLEASPKSDIHEAALSAMEERKKELERILEKL